MGGDRVGIRFFALRCVHRLVLWFALWLALQGLLPRTGASELCPSAPGYNILSRGSSICLFVPDAGYLRDRSEDRETLDPQLQGRSTFQCNYFLRPASRLPRILMIKGARWRLVLGWLRGPGPPGSHHRTPKRSVIRDH